MERSMWARKNKARMFHFNTLEDHVVFSEVKKRICDRYYSVVTGRLIPDLDCWVLNPGSSYKMLGKLFNFHLSVCYSVP